MIDANPNRGSQLAGFLINLGYDSELEVTGARGFGAAAAAADVELILISHDLFGQQWTVNETLANLKADARTAAIPVFIYGPLNVAYEHPNLERNFPGIRFLVQPVDAAMLKKQMKELPNALDATERGGYAREAAELIAGVANQKSSPLAVDSTVAEQALAAALNADETGAAAAAALGHVADPDAQRNLADVVLDPARPVAIREKSAKELVESIRRFGPLMRAPTGNSAQDDDRRRRGPDRPGQSAGDQPSASWPGHDRRIGQAAGAAGSGSGGEMRATG